MAPFDPISILAIVGTTFGVFSFLSSTVENITTRVTHYDECLRVLTGYKHTMETVTLQLEAWKALWSQDRLGRRVAYDEQAYVLFWGEPGFQGIKERTQLIRQDIAKITSLLKCQDIKHYRTPWESLVLTTGESNQPRPKWTYKFLFAIYKNKELKDRISDLKERIGQLQKTSNILFRGRHEARTAKPEVAQVQQIASVDEQHRALLRFLNELSEDNVTSSFRWALQLGTPSLDLAHSKLRGGSRRHLEFIFKGLSEAGVYQHDARIFWPKSSKTHGPKLLDDVSMGSTTTNATSLQSQFCLPQKLEMKTLELLDAYGRSVYALTAVNTAQSTILLNKSPWMSGLCFCGIGIYDFVETAVAYSQQDGCVHVEPQSREQSFLLLAVLLAGIALGAPIQMHLSTANPGAPEDFEVPETHLLHGYTTRMDWETLLELLNERAEVPEHFVTFEYLEAVDYCYELSRRLSKRDFGADDLGICIARIEKPLEKMHDDLKEECRKLAGTTWYEKLASRSRNLQLPELQGDEVAIELE